MIIRKMRASFGKLDGQELKLQPGLNVISGANETGKTTWLAFLMAMLYGVDTKDRVRGGFVPDKMKYQPWNGKPMSGTMELEAEGRSVTLERTSETSLMGDFRAWDTETGSPIEDYTGKTCGQALLGVEAAVYARSGCLRQQRIPVSADAQLEKRLSGLVTSGSEDYSFAEIDDQLKKLQTSIRHNQSGALPRAETARQKLMDRLQEIEDSQRQLSAMELKLNELKQQREQKREILNSLEAQDRKLRQERVDAAEAALASATEDREAWETVCADLPEEEVLQELESGLRQLQNELQRVALEEGLTISELELPEPDPIFKRMGAREAHDKAAADATVVQNAKNAKRPRRKRSPFWLILMLLGIGGGFAGALLSKLVLVIVGIAAALGGLGWWLWLRIEYNRRKDAYISLQKEARQILELYGAKNAKGVVLRGISYIQGLAAEESEEESRERKELEALADRRTEIFERLETLMPGCGTPEKAEALFQEAAKSRQELAQARLVEQQRSEQLQELRFALGSEPVDEVAAARFEGYDRDTVTEELRSLEGEIESTTSRADKLAGAIGQMGDPFALNAEADRIGAEIRRLEDRYAALRLARRALTEADETLRAKFAPLLCQKTGELFSKLTAGKYDGVQLDRSLHVTVHPKDSAVYRPLSYLSGGTVDQLYLALRLAICELLLPKAPIVLDDALVYFDDKRAALALETLKELSESRQVLVFTCQSREKRILNDLAKKSKRKAQKAPASIS